MKQPLYQAFYKNRPIYKPVPWSEMLVLRSILCNVKWRQVYSDSNTKGA